MLTHRSYRRKRTMLQMALITIGLFLATLLIYSLAAYGNAAPSKADHLHYQQMKFEGEYKAAIRQVACPWAEQGECWRCHL